MILAAGLGTRLGPRTEKKPKAMVEWEGIPLVEHVILKLKGAGFTEIIINVHHHAGMIMDYVRKKNSFGIRIEFSHERENLLDTGGGIARAAWFFDDRPFLIYNVDILSNIDLEAMMKAHMEQGAIATMAVKERITSRSLLMSEDGFLKGWTDNRSGETILAGESDAGLKPIAFSAIHIMEPAVFRHFPSEECFPIMPFYLQLARSEPVFMYRHDRDTWMDMGKPESYSNGK